MVLVLAGCARIGNSELQFTPAVFPECNGPNIVVDVAWDATAHTREPIRLMVYKPGNRPKLWYQGAPKGSLDTGKWMADGSTMELLDAQGNLLAMRTLETVPCGSGGKPH